MSSFKQLEDDGRRGEPRQDQPATAIECEAVLDTQATGPAERL